MTPSRSIAAALLFQATLQGAVVIYEGAPFPEKTGWERSGTMDAERWTEAGWFFQRVDLGVWEPPPGGEQDSYQRSLSGFIGETRFFIEWHVETDGDRSEIGGVAPACLVTGTSNGVAYHFTIARNQARLIRDNFIPELSIDIEPGVPHIHRLELYGGELYIWYIDGEIADAGTPEGPFPTSDVVLGWRAKCWYLESTTRWDYIRFGTIPEDRSGDFDTDEDVDSRDFYFFHECLTNKRLGINGGPGNDAGPGCRFADFDSDSDVDLLDYAEFQVNFTGDN